MEFAQTILHHLAWDCTHCQFLLICLSFIYLHTVCKMIVFDALIKAMHHIHS